MAMFGRPDLRKIGIGVAMALAVAFALGMLHESAADRRETAQSGPPAATTVIVRVIGPTLL
ncbi:hypothetical protein EDF56_104180 [Novosphingobium sp. PhB165]|uniref:hypothetical protein n=1 Tax=Novosphingobium sp. PhB165 TaxID=2485105 RepID=UPI001043BA74|nr:hypothetical protein [Novosphingobium sp. PhB165]TCM18650.1 hypothetical protein EDF56_104180 [Novosphingobium sp. PhB165]